jgi:hypothetical protein
LVSAYFAVKTSKNAVLEVFSASSRRIYCQNSYQIYSKQEIINMKKLLITATSIIFIGCAAPSPAPEYLILRADKNSSVKETAFIINKFRTPENEQARQKTRQPGLFGVKPTEEEKKQALEVDANIKFIQNLADTNSKPFSVGSNRQLHYSANYVEVKPGMYQVDVTCLIHNKFASIKVMVPALAGQSTYIKCEMPTMDAATVRASAAEIKETDPNIRNMEFSYK